MSRTATLGRSLKNPGRSGAIAAAVSSQYWASPEMRSRPLMPLGNHNYLLNRQVGN